MRAVFGFTIALTAFCASGIEYFPARSLDEEASRHQFLAEWYSGHLAAMQEPSIWQISQRKPAEEVYRFLYLRTFHHPISVRLTIASDGTGLLTSKETNGKGGFRTGTLIRNATGKLSKDHIQPFLEQLDHFGFWELSTQDPEGPTSTDGAKWIMEASKGGRYHIVDRWSPPCNDPIHYLGTTLMIDLARFPLLYEEVY
ncbi:MAG: hypothetical protein WBL61_22180 [Bryobacteraceae bacterium]